MGEVGPPLLMTFSGLAPTKLKIKKKIRVRYVYMEESFDTIFNMGYWGPCRTKYPHTPPCLMRRENHPCFEGLGIYIVHVNHFQPTPPHQHIILLNIIPLKKLNHYVVLYPHFPLVSQSLTSKFQIQQQAPSKYHQLFQVRFSLKS